MPLCRKSCGTFLSFRYLRTASCGEVPTGANIANTPSDSTSLRVCSTDLGGLKPSSAVTSVILRPFTPPASLIIAK